MTPCSTSPRPSTWSSRTVGPGVMDRLGVGYETLAARNPRLVYVAIRGFGDARTGESPYADWPSYDIVAQAMGGLVSITGTADGDVMKAGPSVGDIFTGTLATVGLLAAVIDARASGAGPVRRRRDVRRRAQPLRRSGLPALLHRAGDGADRQRASR